MATSKAITIHVPRAMFDSVVKYLCELRVEKLWMRDSYTATECDREKFKEFDRWIEEFELLAIDADIAANLIPRTSDGTLAIMLRERIREAANRLEELTR